MRDSRDKRAHHLRLHAEHLETVSSATSARLIEVSRRLQELPDEHFETLVKRDKDGCLARLLESTRKAETLFPGNRS
jgi:hypothetical protein